MDLIDLAVRGLDQEKSLRTLIIDRNVAASEWDRFTAAFSEANTGIKSLTTSLEANKVKLTCLEQSHTESDAKTTNLNRSMDVLMSLNTKLQEMWDDARRVASPSYASMIQVKEHANASSTESDARDFGWVAFISRW